MWWCIRIAVLSVLLTSIGCKSPVDPGGEEPFGGQEVSIHYLKSLYKNIPLRLTEDYVIRGQVVSSDERGNFRYSLVIEDETGGIELKVGLLPYYDRFPVGQTVAVRCAGLVLGAYGRTIQLGGVSANEQYETGFIDDERISEHLLTYGLPIQKRTPALLGPRDIAMRYVSCAVKLDGIQFIEEELGSTWGDGVGYAERRLQFLSAPTDTLTVRTSAYAAFTAEEIPAGSGSLEGVLTQFAGKYSLIISEPQQLTGDRKRF